MREIKFRAWDKTNKRMVQGDQPFVRFDGKLGIFYETHSELDEVQYPNWPVMQYTGLKDKNGKEIYEGDIWKSTAHPQNEPTVVEWLENIGSYQVSKGYGFYEPMQYVEVIGNIYENPELLKERNSSQS